MYELVTDFENVIADFFGSKEAVAVDCCTHALELCLRLTKPKEVSIPTRTYPSIPFTCEKINQPWHWKDQTWNDYYHLGGSDIIDAAVLWKEKSYVTGSMMCLSFQFRKHLALGRGGMILLDDSATADKLRRMAHDGRVRGVLWQQHDISEIGYHYYMLPETAQNGLELFPKIKDIPPKLWSDKDYPYLPNFTVFK